MKREITLTAPDNFRTVWRLGPKGGQEVHVDVFQGDKLLLEWAFPKVSNLIGCAAIFLEQAILYAKNPPGQ